ncbi:MAG: hypothetical protein L0220_30770 [Acidobacteria bacterium]|nr:hypothetical protein [Acidobacteriota bacterium]
MLKKLTFSLIILLFTIISVLVPRVEACTCMLTLSGIHPCQEYWRVSAVFAGQANEVSTIPLDLGDGSTGYRQKLVRFTIVEAFRGVEGSTVEILTGMGGGDCGYDFKKGERYFVYAYRNSNNNKLYAGICGRTMPLSQATSDVEYARAVARGELGGIIFGVVLRYTRPSYQDYGNHKGMEGVPITIEGNGRKFNLKTDNQGRFQLNGLLAGTYKVNADLPDNLRPIHAQEVKVEERKCAAAEFLTTSLGTIQGKLFDSEGWPLSKIAITLIPADTDGNEKSWEGREVLSYTDEQGIYSFNKIPPGKYVIVVNYKGQPGQFEPPFPRTFHPGKSDLAQAERFIISEGQDIKAADFRLPPQLIDRTIEGVVLLPDGQPAAGAVVALEFIERRWMEQHKTTDNQGRFSLKCFEGLTYLIHADHGDNQKRMHAEPVEVVVTRETEPVRLVISKPGRSPYFKSRDKVK